MVAAQLAVTRGMPKRLPRYIERYPDAPHELSDEEIEAQYGHLLAFHRQWVESGTDLDAVAEMAEAARNLSPKHRQQT